MSSGEGVAGGSAGEERGNADVATSSPPPTAAALPPRKPWDSGGGAAPSTPISEILPPQPLASAAEPTAGAELREDQVANAVAFLSHPKVRGSAETSKRAFLQKKGLTQAEIAEAFRRVPTQSAAAAGSDTASPPAASAPPLSSSQLGTPSQTETAHTAKPQPLRWSQVVVGAGLTALIAVGVRRLLEPYRYHILHSLSRAIAPAEDLAAEAKAAQDKEERDATLLARSVASLEEQTAHLATSVQALTTNVSLMQFSRQPQSPAPQPAIPQELQTTLSDIARTLQRCIC